MVRAAGAGAGEREGEREAGAGGGKQVRGGGTTSGQRRATMAKLATASGARQAAQDNLTLAGRVQSSRLVLVGGGGVLSLYVCGPDSKTKRLRAFELGTPITREVHPHFPTKGFHFSVCTACKPRCTHLGGFASVVMRAPVAA